MDRVHDAIEWYQKKIGSYDKQLWEQSVERKLRKQPEFILQNAPRRQVRLKTEFIDVDLIRGSTFTKTKPQVPWVYVTKKAIARVLFFPFYYNWWIHQTSRWGYACLLCLYVLQVTSICVYISTDDGLLEDELSFTEVILPMILMFLLCLIHSQTVLAHITHKPPKHNKAISGVTRKPKPRKSNRKARNSGDNSTCPEDGGHQNFSHQKRQQDNVYSTVCAAQSNHPSQPFQSEPNSQSFNSSSIAQEKIISSQSFHKAENGPHFNRLVQGLSCDSTDGKQLPSALHPSSSSLFQMRGTHAIKEVNEQENGEESDNLCGNQRTYIRTTSGGHNTSGTEKEFMSENKIFIDETKITVRGNQLLSGVASNSSEIGASPSSSWSGSSYSVTLLGNLQSVGSRGGDQDSWNAGFDDSRRTRSLSEGSTMGTWEDLETEQTCFTELLEHPAKIHAKSSMSSFDNGAVKNCDLNYEKCVSIQENNNSPQASEVLICRRPSSSSDRTHINTSHAFQVSKSEGAININDYTKGKPDSEAEKLLSDSGHVSGSSHSCQTSIENDLSIVSSSTIHKTCIPKHVIEIKNFSQIASQNISPSSADPKSSNEDLKLKHQKVSVEGIEKTHKTSSANAANFHYESSSELSNLMLAHKVTLDSSAPSISCLQSFDRDNDSKISIAPEKASPNSEYIQNFSQCLVEKILSSETLLLKTFPLIRNISDSRLQHYPRQTTAQSRTFNDNLTKKNQHDFSSSFSPSSVTLPLSIKCEEDHRQYLSAVKAVKSSASQSVSHHSKLFSTTKNGRLTGFSEQIQQHRKSNGNNTSCLNLHPIQHVKDTPDESNVSDEDEDDNNMVKELDIDADVDDDGEDEGGVMSDFFSHKSVEGSDSDYELDKPTRMKHLRFQRSPMDGKVQQQQKPSQLRCRRKKSGSTTITAAADEADTAMSSEFQSGETSVIKNAPTSLGLRMPYETNLKSHHGDKHVSSSENEGVGAQTPEGSHKAAVSSEEWEDRIQTDETTSSAYSSSCGDSGAESEEGKTRSGRSFDDDGEERTEYTTSTLHVINLLQPGGSPNNSAGNVSQSDRVSCLIWEGNECKKVDLTALDIGWAIIDKVDSLPESSDYFLIGLLFSVIISMIPLIFRAWMNKDAFPWDAIATVSGLLSKMVEVPSLVAAVYTWRQWLLLMNSIMQRFFLSLIFFFLLSVADRTFKQRLLYAKHFSYLTSSRRARKFTMPHFRLSKVRNIKIWLSLRSYLKRRGPQRSVDVIVSACFMCAICTVSLISLQMLKDSDNYLGYLCNWELLIWCCGLAIFLMRFMTVGLKINKKYRNLSVLITEQINLYLQMEQKPHKKDELILANNVLRLAEDLLKELESPFKISGFSANPVIYNIMRVVVLSAFSAVLTEVLGFKLKLYKIKLKA
ncbi:hypothetical protein RRG08_005357 [Elysia crispata]|uniref:PHTF1/2 N-terminal domain-containing protein n=1 Tax=Elysia crispata TaxID=231223 RepID=A0AAE0XY03_9GAST|nr:hypothetical protein RRG08_005357 [Elysia crispata]